MDYLESIFLGIIQGLTEFLPISSSGHIEISKALFDNNFSNQENLTYTIILHFATALSTIIFFRKDILEIFSSLFKKKCNESHKFSVSILISMIPAVFVGLLFEEKINSFFNGNLLLVGSMLIITGLILFVSDRVKPKSNTINFKNSFLIGLTQAIAILPGISRSGATIATAVIIGIDREKAARFSFIMVIPLIFGGMIKSLFFEDFSFENFDIFSILLGFLSAFFTGILACKWMILLVKKSKLYFFSIYCFAIGLFLILYTI